VKGMERDQCVEPRTVSHPMLPCLSTTLTPPVSSARQILARRAEEAGIIMPVSLPPPQPNTRIKIKLYDVESFPAAVSPLNADIWYELLESYPGSLRDDIVGMIRYGAKLGYELTDDLRRRSRR
jgi:hypothetical protein